MAYCPNCGRPVIGTANFCGHCGQTLHDGAATMAVLADTPAESAPAASNRSGNDAPLDVDVPRNPWVGESSPMGYTPSVRSNQALTPGELFGPKPRPATRSNPRGKLIFFALLLAASGLILILAVAPEQRRWQTFVGYVVTEYYWIAVAGGAVCLLLAGVCLVAAIVSSDHRS